MAGGRLFGSTKNCSTSWTVPTARVSRLRLDRNLRPRQRRWRNPKEKHRKKLRAKRLPQNRVRPPRKNLRQQRRSEERRVGKECRWRGWREHYRRKSKEH